MTRRPACRPWAATLLALPALALSLLAAGPAAAESAGYDSLTADLAALGISPDEAAALPDRLAAWAAESGDNAGLPILVVDKAQARVFAYDAQGLPLGHAPALIGSAPGDHTVDGIGDRTLSEIAPEERTTPAGRFRARFGPALVLGEALWVDYAAALALHPVVPGKPEERRRQRLASKSPADNRITYGCINVGRPFYDGVLRPAFEAEGGVVYVLPEVLPLSAVFPGFHLRLASSDPQRNLTFTPTAADQE